MEIWKDVKGYEGYYQVSNYGNAKSIDRYVNHPSGGFRFCKGIILKQKPDKDGYLSVNLKKKQIGSTRKIHRLVCEMFLDNPKSKPEVNHINGIKFDNRLSNLEWCTKSENRQHAYDAGLQNGLSRRGSKNNFAKLSKDQVLKIREDYSGDARGLSKDKIETMITQKDLAKKYNVSSSCISFILKNKSWAWL